MSNAKMNQSSLAADAVAGVAGGIAVVLVGHPFDTVKTLMQTAPPNYYNGVVDCVKKTFRDGGAAGFYRGIGSPLMGQMVFRGLSFFTFFQTMKLTARYQSRYDTADASDMQPTSQQLLVCGAATGFVIAFAEAPIDLVKTKLQIQLFETKLNKTAAAAQYNTVAGCVRYVSATNGIGALWQGLGATIVRNVPANALFFPVNQMVKRNVAHAQGLTDASQLHFGWRLLAGACAGLGYWVTTFPLDVIKARSQSVEFQQRQNWVRTVQSIYSSGGLKAFTRGFVPCATRAVPACAAMFATVDVVQEHLHSLLHDRYNNNKQPQLSAGIL